MEDFLRTYGYKREEWEACLRVLAVLKDDPFNNPDNQILASLITSVHKKAKKLNRKESYTEKKSRDFRFKVA